MHRQVGRRTKQLTRSFAEHFSQLPHCKGDRSRESTSGKRRIAWLENRLRQNWFHDPIWAQAHCLEDDVIYRMNGGSSSVMLANTTLNIPDDLHVTVLEFECDTKRDLADVFDQFDARKSIRSAIEKMRAHAAVEDKLDDIRPTDVCAIVRGMAYAMAGCGDERKLDEDERVLLIHEHSEFIDWAAPFAKPRHLRRMGVVAAMFTTHAKDVIAARRFWTHVVEENHADNHNPTRTLATFLRDTHASKGRVANGAKWTSRAYYAKAIHAWNAWRTDQTTSLSYHANSALPRVK